MTLDYPSLVTVDDSIVIRLAHDADAEIISEWTEAAEVSRFWGGHKVPVAEVLASIFHGAAA